jgi:hypothetical protein
MTDIDQGNHALETIEHRRTDRRRFLAYAGGAAAATGGLTLLAACGNDGTSNAVATPTPTPTPTATSGISDIDVLNFALQLEYLEAQFYYYAAYGVGLPATYSDSTSLLTGVGTQGAVTGGAQVAFTDPLVAQYAREIAQDELTHVGFLRSLINNNGQVTAAVAMPDINIDGTSATSPFSVAAQAAGIVAAGAVFNPYASDENFLLAAYLFEDVGVSAYKGASPLLTNKTYLSQAAGILAVEAYHAGLIRSVLYRKGIETTPSLLTNAQRLSDARDSLDGTSDDDQGIGDATTANIVPTDASTGLVYSRSTGQVLNIVFLTKTQTTKGGFFPSGVNGSIYTSAASG